MGQRLSSLTLREHHETGQTQPLLPPLEPARGGNGSVTSDDLDSVCPMSLRALPVYNNIHRIRRDIIAAIDDPYNLEQLRDPRMNLSVVRPLVDRFFELNDVSIVYCLLVNKAQFLRERLSQSHQQSVCTTRALLCELVANRILRRFNEDNQGRQGLLLLAQILVGGFDPFQGAPKEVVPEHSNLSWAVEPRTGYKRRLPALEIAIISSSKLFLSSSACQRVVNAIYEGRTIYTPSSYFDLLPDHYKNNPIALYNPRRAPILNQYRLMVPRTRNVLEIGQFVILLMLYLKVMADRDATRFGGLEPCFMIYSIGWSVDLTASITEHGWDVYTQNLWSFLDVGYSLVFVVYLVLRLHGLMMGQIGPAQQALDVLAMGAPVLIPRLGFNFMSENMLFVSLRAMMRDFMVLSGLAVWCFAGFLLSMYWLCNGCHTPLTISKWMLWIWFGLDGTGIPRSVEMHWLLGPILMVAFAFLGNTLFLTILVSMLSTTFSTIVANATAEIQFRRAVLTLEGVKSDAIFAYQPPFNLLAILILLPAKLFLTPRWFHKVNVAAVRTLNAPLLLIIGVLERKTLWANDEPIFEPEALPRAAPNHASKQPSRAALWNFSRSFSVHRDIQTVFDQSPRCVEPASGHEDEESMEHTAVETSMTEDNPNPKCQKLKEAGRRSRRDSMAPLAELSGHVRDIIKEENAGDKGATKSRLDKMERSISRIEGLLQRLVGPQEFVEKSSKEGKTARLEDLDRSGDVSDD